MRDQDDQLEQVGQSVGVLKEMAHVIGDELEDQNRFGTHHKLTCSPSFDSQRHRLLGELDTDVTTANDRLKATIKKIDNVLEISKGYHNCCLILIHLDPKQSCCICILLVVLVLMIIIYFAG